MGVSELGGMATIVATSHGKPSGHPGTPHCGNAEGEGDVDGVKVERGEGDICAFAPR